MFNFPPQIILNTGIQSVDIVDFYKLPNFFRSTVSPYFINNCLGYII